jgi:hypothetical protein
MFHALVFYADPIIFLSTFPLSQTLNFVTFHALTQRLHASQYRSHPLNILHFTQNKDEDKTSFFLIQLV